MYEDVTVIEVGTFLTAPIPARILAEFGAEVIKVEKPAGDPFRGADDEADDGAAVTPVYTVINRGKKSIGINLASEEGSEAFLDIARDADVVVENMAPGRMDRFGVGYDDVREVNEDVIYCSVSGYGETGPWAGRKAMDIMAQSMSGLAHQNALRSGIDRPILSGWNVADQLTSAYATIAILAALGKGEGTHIDLSLLDGVLAAFSSKAAAYSEGREILPLGAPGRPYRGPGEIYETATDPLAIYVLNPAPDRWLRVWDALELDEWVEEERYLTQEELAENAAFVEATVEERFASKPREHWLERLWANDLIAAPVLTVEEAFEHEQLTHRSVLSREESEHHGEYLQLNFPAMFSAYDVGTDRPSAALGEHTRELLERAGYSEEEIESLYGEGTVS